LPDRVRAAFAALLLGWLALAAASVPASGAGTFVIPVDLPLTGPGSFFGQSEAQILRIYQKLANAQHGIHGVPLEFQFLDDQSSPQVALQLTGSALANNPTVILGGGTVAACLAMAPLLANGPVQYCLSPAMHPATGSFSFAAYISTEYIEMASVRYFRDQGWRRVGIIATTDASGEQGAHDVIQIIQNHFAHDVSVVDVERFNPTDVSVAAQIARLKASNPQVIVAMAAGAPFGTILRGLSDAGLDLPVNTSSANTTPSQLAQYASFLPATLLANGSIYNLRDVLRPGPLKDACNELSRALQGSGMAPGATELLAWDAARLTVDALRALPPGATAQQLRDYIASLHGYAGVNGLYDFRSGDQHGLTDSAVVVARWDKQRKAMVAASQAGGTPLK
jgi:branched-chain amino acid transport system substrate-binding protein